MFQSQIWAYCISILTTLTKWIGISLQTVSFNLLLWQVMGKDLVEIWLQMCVNLMEENQEEQTRP